MAVMRKMVRGNAHGCDENSSQERMMRNGYGKEKKKDERFFEELGKYIGETATIVGNKAGEVIETQKLKSQVRSLTHENTSICWNLDGESMSSIRVEQFWMRRQKDCARRSAQEKRALQNLRRRSQLSKEQENARIVERW